MFLATLIGVLCVLVVLVDAFETIILPRTVMRRLRMSNVFFDVAGNIYRYIGRMRDCQRKKMLLVAFAPLTLLGLISLWAALIILGWALIYWSLGIHFSGPTMTPMSGLYLSGVTFFTLGYGDIVPTDVIGRGLAVLEAGVGFGFLALVIGYVPVLYTGFSRREVQMLRLDSKAGSDPMGAEILHRYSEADCMDKLPELLKDWERFGAESLESYLSYPLLAYYRSQHDDQSWLKSLTAILDACALIEMGFEDEAPWIKEVRFEARSTFAMGRHVIVDLAYILDVPPTAGELTRLSPEGLAQIRARLDADGLRLRRGPEADRHLTEIRRIYEPYVQGLAQALILDLPQWCDPVEHVDNWQTSAWEGAAHF
ncbi:potassium channel family protein [Fimbriimonas ginsengisoli]|uniref:K+ channel, pore region n=1 Tax=Fimbriimonas ginsengisoli Gsoil 348 TaxID=661478 RepID=A0A068NNT2_FIMGI|nr:potassium channel family protein [Fimbriimonas ginsengisoli]AIE85223.1 K+ channel, pore region [Fimbriimonas ginsengisoli Gsoil 348]